jgi:O-antigen/teichoic acid export membrane protein
LLRRDFNQLPSGTSRLPWHPQLFTRSISVQNKEVFPSHMNQTWTRYLPEFIRQKLEGRPALQQAIGNTGWLFSEKLFRLAAGLFVNIWIARYLGPANYGLLSYALAFTGLFVPLLTLGLDEIVVRNIVRDPRCEDETLGTTFALKLAGGATAFTAATVAAVLLRPSDTLSHWLVGTIAAGSFFQSLGTIDIWFNSQVRSKYAVLARSAAFSICTLVKIVLIVAGAPLLAFAMVITLEVALGSAGLVVAYRVQGGSFRNWRATLQQAKNLLGDSWPLIISFVSVGIYQRIDQVMLQEMKGSSEVGIYSVAVRLSEVWSFIPNAIYWSVFPSIVAAKLVSEELFYERLQRFYNLVALLSYAVIVPTVLLSPWLVVTLFGPAYARSGPMVTGLIWAHLFTSLEIARCAFLTATNLNRIYFLSVFLGCVLNVVLCYYLIPRYGGMGAVAASVLAYWLAAHGSCFLFKRTFKTGFMLSKALVYPKIW